MRLAFPQSSDRSSEIEFSYHINHIISYQVLGFGVWLLYWLFKQERSALSMHGVLGTGFVYLWKSSISFYLVEGVEWRDLYIRMDRVYG